MVWIQPSISFAVVINYEADAKIDGVMTLSSPLARDPVFLFINIILYCHLYLIISYFPIVLYCHRSHILSYSRFALNVAVKLG